MTTPHVPESVILKQVMLEAPHLGARLMRFNNGMYWAGNAKKIEQANQYFLPAGAVVLYDGRPVKTGPPGISDLLGWTKTGQFLAVETKTDIGRATAEQQAFIAAVRSSGGIAGIVRSVDDLRSLLLS